MAPRGFKSISLDVETLEKIRIITGESSFAGAIRSLLRIYEELDGIIDLKYEQGYRHGYKEGFRDGYQKACKEFEAKN